MTALRYLLDSTWKTIVSNRLMNIVSISSIALALMVTGGFLLLQQNATNLISKLKSDTSIVLYLSETLDENQKQTLESKLVAHQAIKSVEYRSKSDAMKIMESRLDGSALEGLKQNPLPSSFHLSLVPSRLSDIENIAKEIGQWPGISDVDYGKQHVERLENVSQIVEILIGSVGLIICVVSIFIIFNTIQLTVVSRENEIQILKLVGATRRFISLPFILGGALQGVIGYGFGVSLLWLIYWLIKARVSMLEFFPLTPDFLDLWRGGLLLVLGFLLGVIGSATAVSRTVRRM